jgi:putative DNA-invertase from lambdoid prophage Rac
MFSETDTPAPPRLRAGLYARVSTQDQDCSIQLQDLRAHAARMGWEAIEYVEKASGKAGGKRPVLARLMEDARSRRLDIVAVWKLDRFGRSLKDFVENVQTLDAAGVRFLTITQPVDTDQRNPFAKFLMNLLMLFAEFERDLIRERVTAGVREYRRNFKAGRIGVDRVSKSGRNLPCGRPQKIFRRDQVAALRAEGKSWRAIAQELKVPLTTVRRSV